MIKDVEMSMKNMLAKWLELQQSILTDTESVSVYPSESTSSQQVLAHNLMSCFKQINFHIDQLRMMSPVNEGAIVEEHSLAVKLYKETVLECDTWRKQAKFKIDFLLNDRK